MSEKISKAIIILLLLAVFLVFLDYAVRTILYPYDWMHSAGYIPFYAQRFLEGKPMYGDNENYPIMCNAYPPVFPVMIAFFSKITGGVVVSARILSFMLSLLTGLIIFLAVKKETAHTFIALVSALLYYWYVPAAYNFPSATSNSAFVFFSILGVFLIRLADEKKIYYIFALLALVLAAYSRQAAFYACAAACIYVFLKSPKKGLLFGLSLSAAIVLLFFIINRATEGWFYENVIANHSGRKLDAARIGLHVGTFVAYFFVPITSALTYSAYSISRKEISIWVIFFLFAFATAFSMGVNGVGPNMVMPAVSAACVLMGIAAHKMRKLLPEKFPAGLTAAVILGIQFFLAFDRIELLTPPSEANVNQWREVEHHLASIDGPILFDRSPILAMRLGKTKHLVEPVMLTLIEPRGRWKGERLLRDIREKKFKAVYVYKHSFFPLKIQETLYEHYKPVAEFAVTEMMSPIEVRICRPKR